MEVNGPAKDVTSLPLVTMLDGLALNDCRALERVSKIRFLDLEFDFGPRNTVKNKNIVPLYQKYCENNLQHRIVIGGKQYFGYNAYGSKCERCAEGTTIAYNEIVKMISNP